MKDKRFLMISEENGDSIMGTFHYLRKGKNISKKNNMVYKT
jgi:hypothetical protein